MKNKLNFSDSEFEQKFINCDLSPSEFSHQAHLRLAWVNIKKYGIDQAVINIQKQLRQFVAFAGAKDKYNVTLTIAATKTVNHFILKSNSDNFTDFIIEFPRLNDHFKDLIDSHYGFDIFASEKAKLEYLEPDLLPFD